MVKTKKYIYKKFNFSNMKKSLIIFSIFFLLLTGFISAQEIGIECSDLDGDEGYFEKSTTCVGNQCKTDYCEGNNVIEYFLESEGKIGFNFCEGINHDTFFYEGRDCCGDLTDILSKEYSCPNGCKDGACLTNCTFKTSINAGDEILWTKEQIGGSYYDCVNRVGKEFLEKFCEEHPEIEDLHSQGLPSDYIIKWGITSGPVSCPPSYNCDIQLGEKIIQREPTQSKEICQKTAFIRSNYIKKYPDFCENVENISYNLIWKGDIVEEGKCPQSQKCTIQQIKMLKREYVGDLDGTTISSCMDLINEKFPNECEGIIDGSLLIAKWGDVDIFLQDCPGPIFNRFLSKIRSLFI